MSRRPTAPLRPTRLPTSEPATGEPATGAPRRSSRSTPPARPGPLVVSAGSAALFAARARTRRWLSWRAVLVAAASLAALALFAWLVLASPLLAARTVSVVGAQRLDPAAVRAAASPAIGTPLARVDTAALAEQISRIPLVKDVEVVRAWPGTLEVRLVERVPLAAVPGGPGRFRLVDAEGVIVAEVQAPPVDLPVVEVELASTRPAALLAATAVLSALPAPVRAEVAKVGAATPDDVRLELRGDAEVIWGSASDNELKSRVLQALRTQPASVYDVSAPLAPVTR